MRGQIRVALAAAALVVSGTRVGAAYTPIVYLIPGDVSTKCPYFESDGETWKVKEPPLHFCRSSDLDPSTTTPNSPSDAVAHAIDEWNRHSPTSVLVFGSTDGGSGSGFTTVCGGSNPLQLGNGQSEVYFDASLSVDVFGATRHSGYVDDANHKCWITEADIRLNPLLDFAIPDESYANPQVSPTSTNPDSASPDNDMSRGWITVLHEMGHALGIDHPVEPEFSVMMGFLNNGPNGRKPMRAAQSDFDVWGNWLLARICGCRSREGLTARGCPS